MAPSSNRSPPASSPHFAQIPDSARPPGHVLEWHGSSFPCHFSGHKRKHASQKKAAEQSGSASSKVKEPDLEQGIRKRLQPHKIEVDYPHEAMKSAIVGRSKEDSDLRDDIAFGRFGVWHPENSVVQKENGSLFTLSKMEDLEGIYKLPKRRQRERRDGPGGALLYRETELLPLGLEEAVSKHCMHPPNVMTFGVGIDGIQWNSVSQWHQGYSTTRDARENTEFGESSSEDDTFLKRNDSVRFSDLKTGDDAIRYFAELETGGPVKFVYCNRVNSGKEFSPYDLVVVPREEVNPEYFIISSAAMVHIEPGPGLYEGNVRMGLQSFFTSGWHNMWCFTLLGPLIIIGFCGKDVVTPPS